MSDVPRVKKRYTLSKKESKQLLNIIKDKYKININKKSIIEKVEFNEFNIYIIDKKPMFVEIKKHGGIYPLLLYLVRTREKMVPEVRVDRGASRAVGRGATLMIPGVRSLDDFNEGDVVVVVDDETGIPVAVGIALLSSSDIRERLLGERRGRAVKIVLRPGDAVWRAAERLP